VLDAGMPGDTMTKALGRIEHDVIATKPDLTIIAFGLNDALGGLAGLDGYRQSLHTALDRIVPLSAVILLTPSMLATVSTDHVPRAHRPLMDQILATQHEGVLDAYVAVMRQVSEDRQVALADAYVLWQTLATTGITTTALLANAVNHPHAYMHDLYVVPMMACLEMAAPFGTGHPQGGTGNGCA
jgi:acyl-CoA thioesterase I